ncbi:MAG: hypothetical protein U0984_15040 [Prosthecobacter sp.]|nr:hypothetical protein [Prosthecobacter sp.]
MNPIPPISSSFPTLWKLCGLVLVMVCWYFPHAGGAAGLVVPMGVLVLLAGLEAAQREGMRVKVGELHPMQVIRGMGSISVGCFYVLLAGLVIAGQIATGPESGGITSGTQVIAGDGCGTGGGCGVSGGCGSGSCGASTGGGCGCGKKTLTAANASKAPAAPRSLPEHATAQLEARMAAMKQGTMSPKARVLPPAPVPAADKPGLQSPAPVPALK